MNRDDYRRLSDDGLADVLILQQRVGSLQKTVEEQQRTIELLQEENRSARIVELVDIREVRRQLAESEQMRNNLSDELQRVRAELGACVVLAAGAIREELLAMEELSELGYLNVTGHNRVDELRSWVEKFQRR